MDTPNLSKAIRTVEVDGKAYFDLEQLLEMMYEVVNTSFVAAAESKDPALGIMTTGMQSLCRALDGVLALHRTVRGPDDQPS